MESKLTFFCFSPKKYLAMVSNASGTLVWYVEYGHGLAFMEISLTIVNSVSFDDFFDLSYFSHISGFKCPVQTVVTDRSSFLEFKSITSLFQTKIVKK